MKETNKLKKRLTAYSWIFVLLAAISAGQFILTIFDLNGAEAQEAGIAGTELAMAIIILLGVIYAIDIIGKVFFAVKGFNEVKGKNKSTGYITFAYVLIAIETIVIAAAIIEGAYGAETDWLEIFDCIFSTYILYNFVHMAKQLHEAK